jgi:nicotinamide mononucleotide transporter PnuC
MKLYASAAYALLFSCTIQIATWVLWKRRPSGSATVFRVMKNWQRALVGVGFCACLILFATLLRSTDSSFPFLDTAISILGILASLLTMLAFVEYAPLMIVSQVLCIVLYALMLKEDPAQITYLVFASYGLVCHVLGFIKVISLKKEQTK